MNVSLIKYIDKKVTKLIVVGEATLNGKAKEYINTLNKNFKLNLEYIKI